MSEPLRLLVVEDSDDDAVLVTRELQRAGYTLAWQRVETANELEAALDRGPWDLIISDFSLPSFSGTGALRLVRERGLDVPFIFVSGTIGEDLAAAAMKAGAQDYVLKGNLKRLPAAVGRELREAGERRQQRRAEQALKESEAAFRMVFDLYPQPMCLLDAESQAFLAVNDAAIRLYGHSRQEFLDLAAADIGMDPPQAPGRTRGRHRLKNGTGLDVEVDVSRIAFGDRTAWLVQITVTSGQGPS